MAEELADSGSEGGIDMDAAMNEISSDLFGVEEEVSEEPSEEPQEAVSEEAAEEVSEDTPEETQEETEETPEVRAAPKSWRKEMHEFWNGLEPAVQDYIEQREQQMQDGLVKDRDDANLGRVMRDVMSPYSEMLKSQGVDESVMVRNLMNAHYKLSTASPEEKVNLFNQLQQMYGVTAEGETQQVDPVLKSVQDKVNMLEQHLTQAQQATLQEARARVEQDVEAFAADPAHEFFDEVSEQIVPLINSGYSLEDAYQNAIWLNPVTRQKEIDRTAAKAAEDAEKAAKEQAEKARKAKSANVRGRDTGRTPTEATGTMEDTLRETFREIQNRSH